MVEHKTVTKSLDDLDDLQYTRKSWNLGDDDDWRCVSAIPFADGVIFILERFV